MSDTMDIEGDESTSPDDDVFADAIERFTRAQSIAREERGQSLADRRFYSIAGAQWEGPLGDQFENKPKFEVNKIHLSVIRIFNEYRNNRISVNFIPKDGSKGSILTDTCNGLYRADEQNSVAEEAYDNAFEEAVGGGFGAFRYKNDYVNHEDPDDERQAVFIEPIFDADSSVYFDPDAKRQDKSDAKYCFVLSSMTQNAFEGQYPDAATASIASTNKDVEFDWFTPEVVYVAEYYVVEKVKETVFQYKGLSGEIRKYTQKDFDDDQEDGGGLKKELAATGFKKIKEKLITTKKIHKYIISGAAILEDLGHIAGKNIPIAPVYGKRWFVDNVERHMGHVRLAKDVQRLKNMQISKLGEIAALSTVEKPILTPEQIKGHQVMWSEDNIKNYPYLLLNPITDAMGQQVASGPIAYTRAPTLPQAMVALLQVTDADIAALLGNQEAGEQISPNISGVAMELVQAKLDMQTYIYISNMAKAIRRGGEIWLSMAKEVYIENDRKCKTINEAGEADSVTLNAAGKNEKTGVVENQNDLTLADFDVVAIPGPTSVSKKAATVRGLINLLQVTQDPETVQVLTSMIMTNMEGEGIGEVRDYFRHKLLTMGVIKPTTQETQDLQKQQQEAANQPPDANTQFLLASAEAEKADAMKSQADVVLTTANAEKSKAQTMQILQDINAGKFEAVMAAIERLQQAALQQGQINGGQGVGAPQEAPQDPMPPPDAIPQHIVQIPN